MFKSKKFILLISILNFIVAQDSPFVGSWKLAPSAGAMKVGPNINDGSWWSSSGADVETRACLFDDEYVFSEDGTFQNILQDTQPGLKVGRVSPVSSVARWLLPMMALTPPHGTMTKQHRQLHFQELVLT